jgi:hypothetical protein
MPYSALKQCNETVKFSPRYHPKNVFSVHALGPIESGEDGILYRRNIAPLTKMAVTGFFLCDQDRYRL